ncbi:hypothetical protein LVD15_19410 [Fulvivirga maritima]|uniref:hypothetical protein n=1 Tax=Fulvivirga maritima TaxID=2904247 RepID=UPI001F23CDC7|nr:hypothetical protein [Fulvivirga maritima]UII25453.1 hypothetical protein LVD15_19410 [Fulvivirga maritima]
MKHFFLVGCLFLLFACGSDDNESKGVSGTVIFDGKEYRIARGLAGEGSHTET